MTQQLIDLEGQGWRRHDLGGFVGLVGPFWTRRDPDARTGDGADTRDGRRYGFVAGEHHLNAGGIVHGGMLMTFIDQAIGRTVWEAIGRAPCATIQLSTYFVEAGRLGDFIEAHTEITRKTRSVVFTRGMLTAAGRTLLTAEGVWKILGGSIATPPPGEEFGGG